VSAGESVSGVPVKWAKFHIKVREELPPLPVGSVAACEVIATYFDLPKALRAAGSAVGKNPVPFVIPCHRVVRKTAEFGSYGGDPARKKAIRRPHAPII
jgi:AraC family transcriptional regulator, regulatory protein of adaptative response / methylated-DNA-[protein]-cysteine methyltransferase